MQISETVVYLMVVAIGIGAFALAAQAVALLLIARSAKGMKERMDEFAPKAQEVLDSANTTLQESRKQITDVSTKANAVLDATMTQVQRTDQFLSEATERARIQLDRVELVLDDSISRIHETIVVINEGVLGPIQQASGIVAGIRTALNYFLRGGRPDISKATTDEEMFI